MFAKSANCETGIAEIFGQVVSQLWACHRKRSKNKVKELLLGEYETNLT